MNLSGSKGVVLWSGNIVAHGDVCVYSAQIRNVETNQCLDNMARKENEKVGIFNCHGMGGNQVTRDQH